MSLAKVPNQQVEESVPYITSTMCILTLSMADGAGLACGVFKHFLRLGNGRPKILAATHFHEIFENGFLDANSHLTFGHMEVYRDPNAKEIENQISYLYK